MGGEPRKNGVKLRLQGQPFQVLTVLLERAGTVVTREELRNLLWPSDTFVDFDHGLNTAMNKVRVRPWPVGSRLNFPIRVGMDR